MDPQPGHGVLGVVEVLVCSEQALEDAGDVTEVEQVVDLGRGGQEARDHCLVHLDGGLRHDVTDRLHLLLKVLFGKTREEIMNKRRNRRLKKNVR